MFDGNESEKPPFVSSLPTPLGPTPNRNHCSDLRTAVTGCIKGLPHEGLQHGSRESQILTHETARKECVFIQHPGAESATHDPRL